MPLICFVWNARYAVTVLEMNLLEFIIHHIRIKSTKNKCMNGPALVS